MSKNQTQTAEQIMIETQQLLHLLAEEQSFIKTALEVRQAELNTGNLKEEIDNFTVA